MQRSDWSRYVFFLNPLNISNSGVAEGGTGAWISETTALTALHTFENSQKQLPSEDFTISINYKTVTQFQLTCRILQKDVDWDIALIEIDTQPLLKNLPVPGIEYLQVDWLGSHSKMVTEGTFVNSYGFAVRNGIVEGESFADGQLRVEDRVPWTPKTKTVSYLRIKYSGNHTGFRGLSGSPVELNDRYAYVIGIIISNPSSSYFGFVEPMRLADSWPELEATIQKYINGKDHLCQGKFKEAESEFFESKASILGSGIKIPEELEHCYNLSKALTKEDWQGAKEPYEELINSQYVDPIEAVEAIICADTLATEYESQRRIWNPFFKLSKLNTAIDRLARAESKIGADESSTNSNVSLPDFRN
ncbi:MAG: hypothetical protein ACE5Q6_01890 [Dehalococcoidia bacterium]